jgi:hypothetical protein
MAAKQELIMDDFNVTDRPERISDDAIRNAQKTEPALQNLLSIDDPDFQAFQNDDPEYFLRAAGTAIRRYCGWPIFPNIRQHVNKLTPGSDGIIMLPSLHVTEVDELTITCGQHPHRVRHSDYEWFQAGYIQLRNGCWSDWQAAGYYGPDQYTLPITQPGLATCTFWHGWHVLPEDVKEVAYELATQSMMLKSGNVKQLSTPGEYKIELTQDAGLTLNSDQRDRLSSYRLGGVA